MDTYRVTYTMPGNPTCVERGMTRLGADHIMSFVLRNGGVGSCMSEAAATEVEACLRVAKAWDAEVKARHYFNLQHGVGA